MAFVSSVLVLTDATPGAPRNSGTNGDLNALMNWALPQAGWTRDYNNAGTNESVFRPPNGIRNRLYVRHDSAASGFAGLAVVRACESATAYNALVDPFPTVAQVADTNCNWAVSTAASTASRPFVILLTDVGVAYFSAISGAADNFDFGLFTDCAARYGADNYASVIHVRDSTSTSATIGMNTPTTPSANSSSTTNVGKPFFMRNITGTVKSSRAIFYGAGANTATPSLGIAPSASIISSGYGGTVDRQKLLLTDSDSQSTTVGGSPIIGRAAVPNVWQTMHSSLAGRGQADTITDAAYNPAATFTLLKSTLGYGAVIENTNTWTGYPAG